jgi:hypothetical protein
LPFSDRGTVLPAVTVRTAGKPHAVLADPTALGGTQRPLLDGDSFTGPARA